MKYIKNCKECGKEFETKYTGQHYCNEDCKIKYRKKYMLEYRKNKKTELKPKKIGRCDICGKEFEKCRSEHVTCSEKCRRIKYKQAQNEQKKRKRKEKKETEKIKQAGKKKRMSELAEAVAEARKKGISYGQNEGLKFLKQRDGRC